MAKHKGSGCEGQASLRREGEGSGILIERFCRWNADGKPGSGILAHRLPSDMSLEDVLDGLTGIEGVRAQEASHDSDSRSEFAEEIIYDVNESPREIKRPSKIVAGFLAGLLSIVTLIGPYKNSLGNHTDLCNKMIADGYYQTLEEAQGLPDENTLPARKKDDFPDWEEEPHLHVERYEFKPHVGPEGGYTDAGKGRGKVVVVGEFRPRNLEEEPLIGDLIGRRIQKNVIQELNRLGADAMALDEVLENNMYTREEVEKKPELLYNIPGIKSLIKGSYELGEPEDDGNVDINIDSVYSSIDNAGFEFRVYKTSGDSSGMETLIVCLAKKVVGEKSPKTSHRGMVVFFLVVWFTISR